MKESLTFLLNQTKNIELQFAELTRAFGSLGAAINVLNLVSEGYKKFELTRYSLDSYLRLDCAALIALNVFP